MWLSAFYEGPFAQDALFSGFPVGIFGFHGESGFDLEVQRCLVLKIDADGVIVGSSQEFDSFHALAFGLGKLDKAALRLRGVSGAFRFAVSHVGRMRSRRCSV